MGHVSCSHHQKHGTWEHKLRTGSLESQVDLRREAYSGIDTSQGDSNHVRVVAVGSQGWVFINNRLAGMLDLSGLMESGDVSAVTGYFGDEIASKNTRVEGITVLRDS